MAEPTFPVNVLTPEATLLRTEAILAILPAEDGQLGVMARHSPLLTRLKPGVLKLQTGEGIYQFAVRGGYARMEGNTLTVLVDEAVADSAVKDALITTELAKIPTAEASGSSAKRRATALAYVDTLLKLAATGSHGSDAAST